MAIIETIWQVPNIFGVGVNVFVCYFMVTNLDPGAICFLTKMFVHWTISTLIDRWYFFLYTLGKQQFGSAALFVLIANTLDRQRSIL